MCSPSRATLLTGRYPAQHGVTLTHTQADLRPDLGNTPAVLGELAGMLRGPNAPRRRALRNFGRGLVQAGPEVGRRARASARHPEPRPSPAEPRLRGRLQGQVASDPSLRRRRPARRLGARRMPTASATTTASPTGSRPTPARTPRPSTSVPATPVRSASAGTRSTPARSRAGSARADLPEPFCLVVSLVNPHDVLGYPAQHVRGGYERGRVHGPRRAAAADGCDESLRDKPSVHELMKMGMAAYLGPLRNERRRSSSTSTSTPICTGWSMSSSAG